MGTRDVAQWIERSFSVHDGQHFIDSGLAMRVGNPSMQNQENEDPRSSLATLGNSRPAAATGDFVSKLN